MQNLLLETAEVYFLIKTPRSLVLMFQLLKHGRQDHPILRTSFLSLRNEFYLDESQ